MILILSKFSRNKIATILKTMKISKISDAKLQQSTLRKYNSNYNAIKFYPKLFEALKDLSPTLAISKIK